MRTHWERIRATRMICVAALVVLVGGLVRTNVAKAGERKYLVILAYSPKQHAPTGVPAGGFTNPQVIRQQYFDKINPGIGSFAEYWEEISYGDVTVSGDVTDWIALPWRIQPTVGNEPFRYTNLIAGTQYEYGTGEAFDNNKAMVPIDLDGETAPEEAPPGSGLNDFASGGARVWTPGERFIDVDGDGAWDGLDEISNESDFDNDGLADMAGKWIDLDRNGEPNNTTDCVYLPDSDNDGNPDCCPNGPGRSSCRGFKEDPNGACPARSWPGPDNVTISDCNGNLIPDACDVSCISQECQDTEWLLDPAHEGMCEGSLDERPFAGDGCDVPTPDGVPDECQFRNDESECGTVTDGLTGCTQECVDLTTPRDAGVTTRCEYDDGNGDGQPDVQEPFENFFRGGFHRSVGPTGDPIEGFVLDDQYIRDNYPGDVDELIFRTSIGRPIYGAHDPDGKIIGINNDLCVCSDGSACAFQNLRSATRCETDDDCSGTTCLFENGIAGGYCAVVCTTSFDCPSGALCSSTGICRLSNACLAGRHVEYNPPDDWEELGSTKMVRLEGIDLNITRNFRTPMPGWYRQAWRDRYHIELDNRGFTGCDINAEGNCYEGNDSPGCADTICCNTICSAMPECCVAENTWTDECAELAKESCVPLWSTAIPEMVSLPDTQRRFFRANRGGLNGRGAGWPGAPNVVFVSSRFPSSFENDTNTSNALILPEELNGIGQTLTLYDGWVEHDDLPSSKYHMAGDQRLGEVTSPFDERNFGDDLAPAISGGDGTISAGGPLAIRTNGDVGTDAGNVMSMEMLTWRTEPPFNNGNAWELTYRRFAIHPFAGPSGANIGFRDYTLDGLVDQGEVRPAGSENYLVDHHNPAEVGGILPGTNTGYPWNRQRLLEDCIEVLDQVMDFDDFLDPVALDAVNCVQGTQARFVPPPYCEPNCDNPSFLLANGVLSGIVLLPPGSHAGGDFLTAPRYYPIHNEDTNDPEDSFPDDPSSGVKINWSLFVHDLVIQTNDPRSAAGDNQRGYSAHEYLHTWEGFPDLYDYDIFASGARLINTPVGQWDIMAGSGAVPMDLVHSVPPLKESRCTNWIESVDLTTVLTPGVDKAVTLPPSAFVRDDSHYFIQNEDRIGEKYYFWSVGSGFNTRLPGAGMLVLHTDLNSSNPEALPPLQQNGTRFNYVIVQADGLGELEAGIAPFGEPGDIWPGSTNNTTFECDTIPGSQWYTLDACTGLTIVNVVPDGFGSVVTVFNWTPTSIPSLSFIDPPGGVSVGNIFNVRTEATDVFGGTWIRLFYTEDRNDITINDDGSNFVAAFKKSTPGTNEQAADWVITNVPDGEYFLFAELIPSTGADGVEVPLNKPRAGRNNQGTTSLTKFDIHVDVSDVVASGTFGVYGSNGLFRTADGSGNLIPIPAGVGVGDQLTTFDEDTRQSVLSTVVNIAPDRGALSVSPVVFGNAVVETWQFTKAGGQARSETWTAVCIDPDNGEWVVNSSLTQPLPQEDEADQDPYLHAFTNQRYVSVNSAVEFTIRSGTGPLGKCGLGDTWTFTTTGITASSQGLTIDNGEIKEDPTAVVSAAPVAGAPPLAVTFDARGSTDPNGAVLQYRWDFGDGSAAGTGPIVSHTFTSARTFTVTLRATNPNNGRFGEAAVDIDVINNSPNAAILAAPLSGPSPLTVGFDGSGSSDTEDGASELVYQWNFGDGSSANNAANPGTFVQTEHFYVERADGTECTADDPCTFVASLTITDTGGKKDTDFVTIQVGNSPPVVNIVFTPLQGPDPWEVIFNASGSSDPNEQTVTVEWSWGDDTPNEILPLSGAGNATDGSVPHIFRLPDGVDLISYEVTATLSDSVGAQTTWPGVTVTVGRGTTGLSEPRAIFTLDPNPPVVDEQFTADASLSFDRPTGSQIATYDWDWGDGATGTGRVATHSYNRVGVFTIVLTVADGEDPPNTNRTSMIVNVTGDETDLPPGSDNLPPSAVFVPNPTSGFAGTTTFTFDASASTDPDGEALTFEWSFGDGGTATGETVNHRYEEPGSYLVRLTVTDESNGSANAARTIEVAVGDGNLPPRAIIATGPRSGVVPLTLTFDGRNSFDPDNDPLTFTWTFRTGDALLGTLTGPQVTQLFSEPGTYTVELAVDDGLGGRDVTELPEPVVAVARSSGPTTPPPTEPEPGQGIDDSANQRPSSICGLGMIFGGLGSLLGLTLTVASRRRRYR